MDTKRKATSPSESIIKFAKHSSPNLTSSALSDSDTSFQSLSTLDLSLGSVMSKFEVVTYRILLKDGSQFVGGISRTQARQIWSIGLKLPHDLVRGIALVQNLNKPFMVDFWLKQEILESELPKTFVATVDGSTYSGEYVGEDVIPLLGDVVKVYIRRTRFRLKAVEIRAWLEIFGVIEGEIEFIADKDDPTLATDDVACRMRLLKHVPNQLPAYGRKLNVSYRGQPIQCGACYGLGHKRAFCKSERADWLVYAETIFNLETNVSSDMLGRWYDLIKESHKK